MGENLTPGGYFTDVYVLFFEKEIMTDSFKIVIEGSKEESSIYFREIGFYKGMEKEYQQEIQNYVRFQEIVNHRKAKQDSAEISFTVFQNQGSLEIFEENVDTIGVPLKVEGFTNGTGYHPSHICTYGLYLAYRYRNNPQKEDYKILRNIMNWIEENSVDKGSFITWEFNEDLEEFNVKAPWSSALTNAWCAGALLQGFEVTGEKHLEENAKQALEYLFVPIEEGGGLYEYDDGGVWFEEVPNIKNPSHILNGHIYVLDILEMFASYYGDVRYKNYFNQGVVSLKQKVKEYDVSYGSIYDLYTRGNQIGNHYHTIHYIQLYYIYLVTNDNYFLNLSRKWFELDNQSDYNFLE